jgi:hypothetical protein
MHDTCSVSNESEVAMAGLLPAEGERQPDDEPGTAQTIFARFDGDFSLMPFDNRPRNGET